VAGPKPGYIQSILWSSEELNFTFMITWLTNGHFLIKFNYRIRDFYEDAT